jgi:hypothetical protein
MFLLREARNIVMPIRPKNASQATAAKTLIKLATFIENLPVRYSIKSLIDYTRIFIVACEPAIISTTMLILISQ